MPVTSTIDLSRVQDGSITRAEWDLFEEFFQIKAKILADLKEEVIACSPRSQRRNRAKETTAEHAVYDWKLPCCVVPYKWPSNSIESNAAKSFQLEVARLCNFVQRKLGPLEQITAAYSCTVLFKNFSEACDSSTWADRGIRQIVLPSILPHRVID